MTLVTQHKPIERLTDMVLMTKKSQIEAWLNGLYTENRYGQCITSKHVHAGRPGVPAPVMIKRNSIFHHLCRSEQYSAFAFFISQSKTNFHVQHIIPVPAGVFALKSCSCCCCPLPFKLRLFIEPICKLFCFESCVVLRKRGGVSQNIILPNYHFFQTTILPEYHSAKIL